jgi:hypothetical protein
MILGARRINAVSLARSCRISACTCGMHCSPLRDTPYLASHACYFQPRHNVNLRISSLEPLAGSWDLVPSQSLSLYPFECD